MVETFQKEALRTLRLSIRVPQEVQVQHASRFSSNPSLSQNDVLKDRLLFPAGFESHHGRHLLVRYLTFGQHLRLEDLFQIRRHDCFLCLRFSTSSFFGRKEWQCNHFHFHFGFQVGSQCYSDSLSSSGKGLEFIIYCSCSNYCGYYFEFKWSSD